jgi:ATP-dependent RNA helicase HelY
VITHDFPLDPFQREAIESLERGRNVLVSAPTGSGKTVVAEHAVSLALQGGGRCFYTAPIKALSNQKYNDLRAVLGEGSVGLLTGDHSIDADAPVVVMTTEVLRNMVYSRSSALGGLRWVVLDEVHFLSDAYRGPVWEEVLIHTPAGVGFVCLSATVSNADELGDWIEALRGPTDTVVEHRRPIELEPLLLVGDRTSEREHLVPLLVDGRPNPEGHRFDVDRTALARHGQRGRPRSRFFTPRRVETIERLHEERLLPTIYFIFSRNGCDEAAGRYLDAGARLTEAPERRRIREIAERRTAALRDADLDVLGYDRWLSTLEHGVAAHHAGMIPAYREAVEECFVEGLLKGVFATETLALGINMPARSVVIERLSKFNGEGHEFLNPGQFTQLTGRAGRRGIDDQGAAIVLFSPFATFEQVANLAASREFPLASSFRPTYNMTANLVERYDEDEAHQVLSRSFAQFQADRAVVRLQARRDRLVGELDALRAGEGTTEAVFDVAGYAALREAARAARRNTDRAAIERSLERLAPGDVIERVGPRGPRLLVVLAVSHRRGRGVTLRATGTSAHPVNIDVGNAGGPLVALTRVELPVPYQPRDPGYRREAANLLRRVNPKQLKRPDRPVGGRAGSDPRAELQAHPLHHHPDRDQLLAGHRSTSRLEREVADLDRQIGRRGAGLVRHFNGILSVLGETGHVDGWSLTPAGRRLRRIYHECDLLISIALERGLFDGLTPPGVAAFASCLTYEHRSSEPPPPPVLPTSQLRGRIDSLHQLWAELVQREKRHRVPLTREPEPGFAAAAHAWAEGRELEGILDEDLTGGDFVRNVRQLIDLLRQLAEVAEDPDTRAAARSASESLLRGVVTSSGGPQ